MAYSVQNDLLEQLDAETLEELTDDTAAGAIDTGVVSRSIDDADAEINGYVGKRYTVPLSPVPPIVRALSVIIAIYNLYARRRGAPDHIRQRYVDAIDFLRGVAAGKNSLGEEDPDGSPAASHQPRIAGPGRIFSRDSLKGY